MLSILHHRHHAFFPIDEFIGKSTEEIIGAMTMKTQFDATKEQIWAWEQQIPILKNTLNGKTGTVFFEFSIPRMGSRVDAILIIHNIVFIIEFKVGETKFHNYNIEQVWDYALDLKNFHKPSHNLVLAPVLVATEFHIQGLELDWVCVTWDGDLRYKQNEWEYYSFAGNKWRNVIKEERKRYLLNAYRVLLTRARQGMIIVVPEGNPEDLTRKPEFYDGTFNYLKSLGIPVV